jgi:hypothetical protein
VSFGVKVTASRQTPGPRTPAARSPRRIAALVALPLVLAAWVFVDAESAATAATPTALPSDCGSGGSWPVKIGTDSQAGLVDLTSPPIPTTVAQLTSLPLPSPIEHRVQPTEVTVYTITATVTDIQPEPDRDRHLVVNDGSGHFMITELPDPACVPTSSPFYPGISQATSQLAAWSGSVPATVQITGVGFFDAFEGGSDQAPNQIELHPILNLNFNPGAGGYALDGYGAIHPFSFGSGAAPPGATGTPSWPGWDIARGLATLPASGGLVVDGWGGLHGFTIAGQSISGPVNGAPYWPGWDIARGVALLPDGTGGYVLDGWGGLHPFGLGSHQPPTPTTNGAPYWPGWDIARGVAL